MNLARKFYYLYQIGKSLDSILIIISLFIDILERKGILVYGNFLHLKATIIVLIQYLHKVAILCQNGLDILIKHSGDHLYNIGVILDNPFQKVVIFQVVVTKKPDNIGVNALKPLELLIGADRMHDQIVVMRVSLHNAFLEKQILLQSLAGVELPAILIAFHRRYHNLGIVP